MNPRIQTLIDECTTVSDDLVYDGENSYMKTHEYFDKEKFAQLIVRELVSTLEAEYCDFYHNEANDWGCITVKYFVPGDAHLMRGEETKAEYVGGVIKGTGRFRLNERFVEYLMKNHFGVEE